MNVRPLPEINVHEIEEIGRKTLGGYKSIPALHPNLYNYIKRLETENSTLKEQIGSMTP